RARQAACAHFFQTFNQWIHGFFLMVTVWLQYPAQAAWLARLAIPSAHNPEIAVPPGRALADATSHPAPRRGRASQAAAQPAHRPQRIAGWPDTETPPINGAPESWPAT